ncbi:MAG: TIGR03617 family F420-dependent LLM class oxidoreductase [Tepidiformaceae bacterium]
MKVELALPPAGRGEPAALARRAEALGYSRVTATETAHDPFLPLGLAAAVTERIELATSIAVAFPRSPMVTAQTAWDLQELSGGRFQLGLGTQVKGQIERRYGIRWTDPAPRMREYILALRATWQSWQAGGTRLNFTGDEYQLTLMTPEYSPGVSSYPSPPVLIAGSGPAMVRTAGEVADGLRLPAFTSLRYAKESVVPLLRRAMEGGGRKGVAFDLCAQPWLAMGTKEQVARQFEGYRRAVALHGGAKTYRAVWDAHGWGEVAGRLYDLATRQEWAAMPRLVSDEMVDAFVVHGTPDEVAAQLREGWGQVASAVGFPVPDEVGTDDETVARCVSLLAG